MRCCICTYLGGEAQTAGRQRAMSEQSDTSSPGGASSRLSTAHHRTGGIVQHLMLRRQTLCGFFVPDAFVPLSGIAAFHPSRRSWGTRLILASSCSWCASMLRRSVVSKVWALPVDAISTLMDTQMSLSHPVHRTIRDVTRNAPSCLRWEDSPSSPRLDAPRQASIRRTFGR